MKFITTNILYRQKWTFINLFPYPISVNLEKQILLIFMKTFIPFNVGKGTHWDHILFNHLILFSNQHVIVTWQAKNLIPIYNGSLLTARPLEVTSAKRSTLIQLTSDWSDFTITVGSNVCKIRVSCLKQRNSLIKFVLL